MSDEGNFEEVRGSAQVIQAEIYFLDGKLKLFGQMPSSADWILFWR